MRYLSLADILYNTVVTEFGVPNARIGCCVFLVALYPVYKLMSVSNRMLYQNIIVYGHLKKQLMA